MQHYYEIEVKDGSPCAALMIVPNDLAERLTSDDLIKVLKPAFAYLFKMAGASNDGYMDIEYEVFDDITELNLPDDYDGMMAVKAHATPQPRKYLFLVRSKN